MSSEETLIPTSEQTASSSLEASTDFGSNPESINPLPPPKPSIWAGVRSFIRETLETIALTLIIFVAIRAGIQNFRIEGFSMEPNFHDGQYLIVSKLDYYFRSPERGDVIVFVAPTRNDRDYIKRVIGLPGETVEIRAGKIFINGQLLQENYKLNQGSYNWGPQVVGADQLFVLGDNRNNSSDSHSWGMLPANEVIGKAWVTYWPPDQWGIVQNATYTADAVSPTAPPTPAQQPLATPRAVPTQKPYP